LRTLKDQAVLFLRFAKILSAGLHHLFQVLGVGVDPFAHFIEGPGQVPQFVAGVNGDGLPLGPGADLQGAQQQLFDGPIDEKQDIGHDYGGDKGEQGQAKPDGLDDVPPDLFIQADQGHGHFEETQFPFFRAVGMAGGCGTTGLVGNGCDDAQGMLAAGALLQTGPLGQG